MNLRVFAAVVAAGLSFAAAAQAGYYTCEGNAHYTNGRCSDGSMAIYHADTVKTYQGHAVKPDRGQNDNGTYNGNGWDNNNNYGRNNRDWRQDRLRGNGWSRNDRDRGRYDGNRQHSGGSMQQLFGAWSTNVAGAVWTSPSEIPGWSTLHVSPGAIGGLLVIYPGGRYIWNSYGGKRGKWRATGDSGYPIQLIDTVERRLWNVGLDDRHPGHIYINESHGYYYYTGRRP